MKNYFKKPSWQFTILIFLTSAFSSFICSFFHLEGLYKILWSLLTAAIFSIISIIYLYFAEGLTKKNPILNFLYFYVFWCPIALTAIGHIFIINSYISIAICTLAVGVLIYLENKNLLLKRRE